MKTRGKQQKNNVQWSRQPSNLHSKDSLSWLLSRQNCGNKIRPLNLVHAQPKRTPRSLSELQSDEIAPHQVKFSRLIGRQKGESNPVILPDLYFYWSLCPVAFIVIIVRGIVCVVSSNVPFSNDRVAQLRGSQRSKGTSKLSHSDKNFPDPLANAKRNSAHTLISKTFLR